MNTYRIFEEFRASLGEPAAKALAETLGSMFEEMKDTVTKAEFRALAETIDSRASRMEAAILGKAGLATVALVACEAIAPESLAFARMKNVRVWCNGSLLESAA